jgi:hypothetical protein
MTNKITLVSSEPLTLHSNWIVPEIESHVNLEIYNAEKTYDKKSTVFYASYLKPPTQIQQHFVEQGFKIVYDNLWEAVAMDNSQYILQHCDWFRHYESLWYRYLGYHTYRPNNNFTKLAFMPMRVLRPHRTRAVEKLQPWLDDFVWSYAYQGRELPNGGDAVNDWNTQRLFRPEWYDDTCFSFVSENGVMSRLNTIFITEKSYKPMAFYHAFVIMGPMGILAALKRQGFETFENLFDESYDTEPNWHRRLDCLVKNVSEYKKQPYDALTQQKIQHNHAWFFDHAASHNYINEQIIHPLLNYAET